MAGVVEAPKAGEGPLGVPKIELEPELGPWSSFFVKLKAGVEPTLAPLDDGCPNGFPPDCCPKRLPPDLLSVALPNKDLASPALLLVSCPWPPNEKLVFPPPNRLPPVLPAGPDVPNSEPDEAPEEDGCPKLKPPDMVSRQAGYRW